MAKPSRATHFPTKLEHITKYNIMGSFKHFDINDFERISSLKDIDNLLQQVLAKDYTIVTYCDRFIDNTNTETKIDQVLTTTPIFASDIKIINISITNILTKRHRKIHLPDAFAVRKYHGLFKNVENALADLATPKLKIVDGIKARNVISAHNRVISDDILNMASIVLREELRPAELRVYKHALTQVNKLQKIIERVKNSKDPWVVLYPKIADICNTISFYTDSSFNGVLTGLLYKNDTSMTKSKVMSLLINTMDMFQTIAHTLDKKNNITNERRKK